MSRSIFRGVVGRLEYASRTQIASIVIDRDAGTFAVRPRRRRRLYTLPLAEVAGWVVRTILLAELREKRAARKRGRTAGSSRAAA